MLEQFLFNKVCHQPMQSGFVKTRQALDLFKIELGRIYSKSLKIETILWKRFIR